MLIIDRFEGFYAICETNDGSFEQILRTKLPSNSQEGDCLVKLSESTYIIDQKATAQYRKSNSERFRSLQE